jgi:hypothetical protein
MKAYVIQNECGKFLRYVLPDLDGHGDFVYVMDYLAEAYRFESVEQAESIIEEYQVVHPEILVIHSVYFPEDVEYDGFHKTCFDLPRQML